MLTFLLMNVSRRNKKRTAEAARVRKQILTPTEK